MNEKAMELSEIIENLEQAKGHLMWIDEEIAVLIGYRKVGVDPPSWLAPNGARLPRSPYFTLSLDRAYEFAQAVLPDGVVAVARTDDGVIRAVVDGGPQCEGANKAIAVILATLKARLRSA